MSVLSARNVGAAAVFLSFATQSACARKDETSVPKTSLPARQATEEKGPGKREHAGRQAGLLLSSVTGQNGGVTLDLCLRCLLPAYPPVSSCLFFFFFAPVTPGVRPPLLHVRLKRARRTERQITTRPGLPLAARLLTGFSGVSGKGMWRRRPGAEKQNGPPGLPHAPVSRWHCPALPKIGSHGLFVVFFFFPPA